MKVKVIEERREIMGDFTSADLFENKIYEVIEIEPVANWYRIVDESGEGYLYPPELFEIVEDD